MTAELHHPTLMENTTTLNSITEKLHAKADRNLQAWLDERLNPIFDECKNLIHPESVTTPQEGILQRPWIGKSYTTLKAVAFAYLRNEWREKAVREFMGRVDSLADELDQIRQEIPL